MMWLRYWLKRFFRCRRRAVRIIFIVGKVRTFKMQIRDNKTLLVSITAQDSKGNAAKLAEGAVPAWDVDNAALASLEVSADGMSAVVSPSGPLGDFKVQVSVPAIGDEPAFTGELPVTIVSSAATSITLAGSEQ